MDTPALKFLGRNQIDDELNTGCAIVKAVYYQFKLDPSLMSEKDCRL